MSIPGGGEWNDGPVAASGVAAPSAHSGAVGAETRRELATLRAATARFHRLSEAERAHYKVLVTHPETGEACLEHEELGGMGRHYLNPGLVSDDVSVPQPEVLLYEPGPNGRLALVGVEYLIPFDIRGPEEAPPVLYGQEFHKNHTFNVWALHVWAWKHNPSGMFADWNPMVSCEYDDRVLE